MRLSCRQLPHRSIRYLLLILLFIAGENASAQNSKIFKGVVTNENGEPLPGVTVALKDSKTSIATDANGAFSIEAKEGATIVVSSIGFIEQQFTLRGNGLQSIKLTQLTQSLERVVVVGYGTQRSKDLT